jgi:hypothetical protein
VNEKTNIRYIGFRSANNGGRTFDFWVSAKAQDTLSISVEIPSELFVGVNHIHLQEGVGICYAKLKHLFQTQLVADIPQVQRLTASDLAQYRQAPAEAKRRWGYGSSPDAKKTVDKNS